jgi:hypothetical protein
MGREADLPMNHYVYTAPAGSGAVTLPSTPSGGLLTVTLPVAFTTLEVSYTGGVSGVTYGPNVTSVAPSASDVASGFGSTSYSGPAGGKVVFALNGAGGVITMNWSPAANPGSSSKGYNVNTFTIAVDVVYPASYGAAMAAASAKAAAAAGGGAGGAGMSLGTKVAIAAGVVGTGAGGMVLAGLLTDNGPGWLFGLAAAEARGAGEAVRRRARR